MKNEIGKFHLGDILSVSTGILVSPRRMDGVYDILNYMTNDNLFTHQLIRARQECAPKLIEQLPWLAEINADSVNTKNWEKWLKRMVEKYGEYHIVRPIHPLDHELIDPVEELRAMAGDKKIITINLEDEQ